MIIIACDCEQPPQLLHGTEQSHLYYNTTHVPIRTSKPISTPPIAAHRTISINPIVLSIRSKYLRILAKGFQETSDAFETGLLVLEQTIREVARSTAHVKTSERQLASDLFNEAIFIRTLSYGKFDVLGSIVESVRESGTLISKFYRRFPFYGVNAVRVSYVQETNVAIRIGRIDSGHF